MRFINAVFVQVCSPLQVITKCYTTGKEVCTMKRFSLKILYLPKNCFTSDDHRKRYGEIFRDNNFCHFPDMVALNQDEISTPHCFKCDQKFESYADLLIHVRSHKLPERDPDGYCGDYCEECKVDTRAGHPHHKNSIAMKQTIFCIMCSMRIFRSKQLGHFKHAHPNDYFRYHL